MPRGKPGVQIALGLRKTSQFPILRVAVGVDLRANGKMGGQGSSADLKFPFADQLPVIRQRSFVARSLFQWLHRYRVAERVGPFMATSRWSFVSVSR